MSPRLEELKRLLDYLEAGLDQEKLNEIEHLCRRTLDRETVPRLPLVLAFPFPSNSSFRPFPHGTIFRDLEKHLYNELVYAFDSSVVLNTELGCDLVPCIRPNFGIGLVSSVLGALVEQIDDNPPWVRPFASRSELHKVFTVDPTDVAGKGWIPRVIEAYQFFDEALGPYPGLCACLKRTLPDLQGPFDNYALLRGGAAFSDFYLDPELLTDGLSLAAQVQIHTARTLLPHVNDHQEGFSFQHGVMMKGAILIRNDSAVMLSAELYRRFVAPHDATVLAGLGGGGIHSCGAIDHQIENYLELKELHCIDLGQALMNDRQRLFRLAAERRTAILRMEATEDELLSGRVLEMFPTGVILVHRCKSYKDAADTWRAYKDEEKSPQ